MRRVEILVYKPAMIGLVPSAMAMNIFCKLSFSILTHLFSLATNVNSSKLIESFKLFKNPQTHNIKVTFTTITAILEFSYIDVR